MEHWLKGDRFAGATSTAVACPPGRFYHVAGVVDKKAGRTAVYIDGVERKSLEWPAQSATRDYGRLTWRIGIMLPGATKSRWASRGIIDEVRLYHRALSAAEIEALAKVP